jgi:hypothetical protein
LERTLSTTSTTSSRKSLSGKKRNPAGNSDELYRSTSITSEDCREHEILAKKNPKLLLFASGGLRKRKITYLQFYYFYSCYNHKLNSIIKLINFQAN